MKLEEINGAADCRRHCDDCVRRLEDAVGLEAIRRQVAIWANVCALPRDEMLAELRLMDYPTGIVVLTLAASVLSAYVLERDGKP